MIVSTRRANILEQDDLVISSQMDKFLKPCTQKHYSNSHGQDCFHVHCCAFSMYTTTPYGRKSLTLKCCIYGYKQKCVYVEITAVTLLIIYATPTLENLHY